MRREIPILITMVIGWVMVMDFFFPPVSGVATRMRDWTLILIAISQMLGVANVARINLDKVSRKHPDAPYAMVLLLSLEPARTKDARLRPVSPSTVGVRR